MFTEILVSFHLDSNSIKIGILIPFYSTFSFVIYFLLIYVSLICLLLIYLIWELPIFHSYLRLLASSDFPVLAAQVTVTASMQCPFQLNSTFQVGSLCLTGTGTFQIDTGCKQWSCNSLFSPTWLQGLCFPPHKATSRDNAT